LELSVLFYKNQEVHLGNYFLNSIFADIESLYIYAGIHFKVNGYHRLLAKNFPFAIYYKVKNNIVYIYAVLDCRQNPKKLEDRLG